MVRRSWMPRMLLEHGVKPWELDLFTRPELQAYQRALQEQERASNGQRQRPRTVDEYMAGRS